jgi:hypothetical protein
MMGLADGLEVDRGTIPDILGDQELMGYIEWWVLWKKFGWPFSGGWAEQPAVYFDVVELLEAESERFAEKQRHIAEAKAKSGKRHR